MTRAVWLSAVAVAATVFTAPALAGQVDCKPYIYGLMINGVLKTKIDAPCVSVGPGPSFTIGIEKDKGSAIFAVWEPWAKAKKTVRCNFDVETGPHDCAPR